MGLYLNPPDQAVVLCVGERTPIQALERTQPMLPGTGHCGRCAHEYLRTGTTTLFAGLDGATGKVLAGCKRRHRRSFSPSSNRLGIMTMSHMSPVEEDA